MNYFKNIRPPSPALVCSLCGKPVPQGHLWVEHPIAEQSGWPADERVIECQSCRELEHGVEFVITQGIRVLDSDGQSTSGDWVEMLRTSDLTVAHEFLANYPSPLPSFSLYTVPAGSKRGIGRRIWFGSGGPGKVPGLDQMRRAVESGYEYSGIGGWKGGE